MVLETLVYSPFDQLTADEVRDGPRNVGLFAIRPADAAASQRFIEWKNNCLHMGDRVTSKQNTNRLRVYHIEQSSKHHRHCK